MRTFAYSYNSIGILVAAVTKQKKLVWVEKLTNEELKSVSKLPSWDMNHKCWS